MTEKTILLSDSGRKRAITRVLENAIEQFDVLEGSSLTNRDYSSYFYIVRVVKTKKTRTKSKWFRKDVVEDYVVEDSKTLVGVDYGNYVRGHVFEVYSKSEKFDDVAIWIGGQVEGLFDIIEIMVQDASKLGKAIGWRCAYCNQTTKSSGLNCSVCHAPRGY